MKIVRCSFWLKMVARSRRAANAIAEQRLESSRIGDEDALAVLRRWYFNQKNSTRTNVIPNGSVYVESDTSGVARTRTGTVVTTKMTKKCRSVFHLLCRWLYQHSPDAYRMPFPFTSISVNHGYGAKKHRDAFKCGPP